MDTAHLEYDFERLTKFYPKFEAYFKGRNNHFIPESSFAGKDVWLEIGAGSGQFFAELAQKLPAKHFIAVERDKERAATLVGKMRRLKLPNFEGYRGNAISALLHGIPSNSVEKIFIMYPCPFYRPGQRKHRWYMHAVMPHFFRILKDQGQMIWTSDQKFYIDEAHFILKEKYAFDVLSYGEVSPNPHNYLEFFPGGRTKFERSYLELGHPVYEVIVQKVRPPNWNITHTRA